MSLSIGGFEAVQKTPSRSSRLRLELLLKPDNTLLLVFLTVLHKFSL